MINYLFQIILPQKMIWRFVNLTFKTLKELLLS